MSRSLAAASLPETFTPRAIMIRAMPDMPAPPMPVKCTRPSSARGTGATGLTRLPMSAHRPRAAWLRAGRPAMMFMTSAASRSSVSRLPSRDAAADIPATSWVSSMTGSSTS